MRSTTTSLPNGREAVVIPAEPGFREVRIKCADGFVAKIVRVVLASEAWNCVSDAQRVAREMNSVREMEEA